MSDNLEIKTSLTVDAAAAESTLGGLRKQLEMTSQAREVTQAGMGMMGQTLSTMAGMYLPQVIHKVYEYGDSFVDAARNEDKFRRAITGLASAQQDISWEKAAKQGKDFNDRLDEIAVNADTTADDIKEAFTVMTEIGGGSAANLEKSVKAVEDMSSISRVLGISASAVTREYEMMGEGMLRTRGQLFQLLHTTGIFGDDIHKAAAGWQKLTEEQRTQRLQQGMDKLSDKMKLAPEGFGAVIQKMKTMEEIAKAQLGTPLLQAIVPQLEKVMHWMQAGRGSIEDFAKHMASDVSKYAEEAGKVVREGWEYVTQHWDEINKGIKDAWGFAKGVIEFAVDHKEALAIAFGAKMVLGSAPGAAAIGVGKAVFSAGASAAAGGGAAAAAGGGLSAAAIGAGAIALGAFTAAIGGVAAAAWQAGKLIEESSHNEREDVKARKAMLDGLSKDFTSMDSNARAHVNEVERQFSKEAYLLGMNKAAANDYIDSVERQYAANRELVWSIDDAASRIEDNAKNGNGTQDVADMTAQIAQGFEAARAASNTGAEQHIADLLAHSKTLQQAFLDSAALTSEGYTMLAEMTKASASDFSDVLKGLAEQTSKNEKQHAKVPNVQFNGGQTFKIQQDFRDENPDRVAIVFQRDILAAAERRYQSSYASPFGS